MYCCFSYYCFYYCYYMFLFSIIAIISYHCHYCIYRNDPENSKYWLSWEKEVLMLLQLFVLKSDLNATCLNCSPGHSYAPGKPPKYSLFYVWSLWIRCIIAIFEVFDIIDIICSGWLESIGSRILYELYFRKQVHYVIPTQIITEYPGETDSCTRRRHGDDCTPPAQPLSGDHKPGAGDGCHMWFSTPWHWDGHVICNEMGKGICASVVQHGKCIQVIDIIAINYYNIS